MPLLLCFMSHVRWWTTDNEHAFLQWRNVCSHIFRANNNNNNKYEVSVHSMQFLCIESQNVRNEKCRVVNAVIIHLDYNYYYYYWIPILHTPYPIPNLLQTSRLDVVKTGFWIRILLFGEFSEKETEKKRDWKWVQFVENVLFIEDSFTLQTLWHSQNNNNENVQCPI